MAENATQTIPADVQKMSFEEALEELRHIVGALERGDGKLDDAIASYQRGAELKAHCESKLRDAQEKVEKISLSPGGEIKTEAFDVG
ncbi:exodeoxyribonuclease VII small subunit [Pelagibius sp. Alg239-R121]|uniref:exodeoxyribonuclease VII small subunit n=1 Tax=Pelagibius sp. Alg239-R121 TaxID=2993448 RepID=UPI0024A751E8|nr:exodeoxyribonuclease VII small subunit [Pelagibius sp. Alg239-R121]